MNSDVFVDGVFLRGPADWWRQAVIYQIYPRSFFDSNADGLGDIKGIISKVDYISSLGVDAVWLSPFYPSQLADGGYDVDDYRDVDPRLGTLNDIDDLTSALHAKGIRIFVDIVPNHSSNLHVWFQEALRSPAGSAARNRYIFRDGRGANGELPPSDLVSHFGPEGWTRVEDGQWYMHLFTREQPDFNWDNPEVHEEFLKTLKFWSDRGVDGFRVDVAHALKKQLDPLPSRTGYDLSLMKADGTDELFDRDEVHEIYKDWRQVFNQYDPPRVAVAEAWVHPNRVPAYASQSGLGQSFNFDLLVAEWSAPAFHKVIAENLKTAIETGSSSTWVMSNHDVIRHTTRLAIPGYGKSGNGFAEENDWYINHRFENSLDLQLGLERALAATLLILALPGSTYIYQGEELGLHDYVAMPDHLKQDPQWFRGEGKFKSRDGCRVPLPWDESQPAYGFSSVLPHLPQPDWFAGQSVASQENNADSVLNLYRRAIKLRRELEGAEELSWLSSDSKSFSFERPGGWVCVTNFSESVIELPAGEVLLSSKRITGEIPPNCTVWLKVEPNNRKVS